MSRRLHLNAFLMESGHHEAAWRLPESDPHASTSIAHFQHLARVAERGKLDSLFLADSPVLWGGRVGRRPSATLEPTVLLTALAGVTSHIGLIATASTTYNEPYNLARRFASLDHISGGRAGWNIVTTAGLDAARNFNLDELPAHRDRYMRAAEFVEVAVKLWDSWDDDAVLADKETGVWGDEARIHPAAHAGEFYRVAGALDVSRSPQGRPLLVQAGSSEDGKDFAARYAEAVFTAQQTLADAQAFYADLKHRVASAGRDPHLVKILPGLVPVLGGTEAQARERAAELERLQVHEYGLHQLSELIGVPLGPDDLDCRLPPLPQPEAVQGMQSRFALVTRLAQSEDLTVRQLLARLGGGRGHRTFTGTPEQVADTIAEWFHSGAADGFNIMPPLLPSGLEEFVNEVVPILRRRGLFRTAYEGATLREHYGLPRPANQFTTAPEHAGSTA
jgi:FMN-dependent oxidoreductase (nitrilotriacetate monooxygenase family)